MLNKTHLIFKFLLLTISFNLTAQIPVSIQDIDLADQSNFDNWTYEDESFFVVPVQLNEYVELEQISFNIKFNSNIVTPVSDEVFIQLNQEEFLNSQDVDDLSLLANSSFNSQIFPSGSQYQMLTVYYSGSQAINSTDFQDQNGTLVYLGFIKQDPCYEGPILLQFWDGLEEGVYLNPDHTSAVTINQTISTDNNQIFSIDGSIVLNVLSIELVQDGSNFSVLISDGTPPFSYNWTDKMDQSLSFESDFSPTENADYLVFVSDFNQCTSTLYFSFEQTTFIEEHFLAKVGPNPFNNYINLDFSSETNYVLMNINGEIVRQAQNIISESIDTQDLNKGVYFLKTSNLIDNRVLKLISTK